MEFNWRLKIIIIGTVSGISLIILLCLIYLCCRKNSAKDESGEMGNSDFDEEEEDEEAADEKTETEELISFPGGENLSVHDILDAPGEVVGKSSYGTLYKANLERDNSVKLLRFLRPACTGRMKENSGVIPILGFIRHPNLVPLQAFYSGTRGEKLLVHPFYGHGNLAQFLRDGNGESHKWPIIYKISLGIVRGLDHLHTGLHKPVIHGNLKSKNILLGGNYQPYLSDFSLHLILNLKTSQEMLEASADQGYKAPELIKMKDASQETDIYSLGVILLEIISGKEPIDDNPPPNQDPYLPNSMRNAIIDHRISDIFQPNLFRSQNNHPNAATEECLLVFFRLAMACCSPSPYLRPDIKQILSKLEEIGQ